MSNINKTKTKTSYIKSAKEGYANLGEEILDLHTKVESQGSSVESVSTELAQVKTELTQAITDIPQLDTSIVEEVIGARGAYDKLADRLSEMDAYTILSKIENLTTTRTYDYDNDGYIIKEIVRGDLNYDVNYTYDNNKNIIKEERYADDGTLMTLKNYDYDIYGNITSVTGFNTDDIIMNTNTLVTKELDMRLKAIEKIDFIRLSSSMRDFNAEAMWKLMQDILVKIQTLELALPDGMGELIEISNIYKRLSELENQVNKQFVAYTFTVSKNKSVYDLPPQITASHSVYIEGLLLDGKSDYTIANSKITFHIPLIDGFTITCRY